MSAVSVEAAMAEEQGATNRLKVADNAGVHAVVVLVVSLLVIFAGACLYGAVVGFK